MASFTKKRLETGMSLECISKRNIEVVRLIRLFIKEMNELVSDWKLLLPGVKGFLVSEAERAELRIGKSSKIFLTVK